MQINNENGNQSVNDSIIFFFEESNIDKLDKNNEYEDFFQTQTRDEDDNNQDSNYHLSCNRCKAVPEISFDGAYNFKIECDCSHCINVDIKYLKEKYLINKVKDLDKNFYKYRKCRKHSLKYYAHCFDCSKDICEQCLSEEEELHETHEMLIYPNFRRRFKKILDNAIPKMNESFIDKTDYIKLFNIILKDYIQYPNYSSYKTISNSIKFLESLNENDRGIFKRENKKKEFYIKIKSLRELKDILNNNGDKKDKIESIKINSQNFFDLNLLNQNNTPQIEYPHLKLLDLKQNNISDIKPLSSIKFPELVYLNLSKNRISDENIETILNLNINCPKLKFLDLSDNAFTKYELLNSFKNFDHLESINIGNNLLNKDLKSITNKELNFDFPQNLEELFLSFGIFSNETINIMQYVIFNNLKKLDLSKNNLNSLSFLENINLERLEELWLSNNFITEFEVLKNYKELKKINLKKNKISDISNLNEFLNEFPNIEKMVLIDNNIDVDDIENEKIINKAKKHRNSSNDKIQIFF